VSPDQVLPQPLSIAMRPPASRQCGFTIIEVVIASVLLAMLMSSVMQLAVSGADAQGYASRLNRVTEIAQDIVDDVRLDLASSVSLFGRDTVSQNCHARIDFTGWPTPLSTSLLPRIADTEEVAPDAGNVNGPKTGNMLFFAQRAWVDRFICSSGRGYMT